MKHSVYCSSKRKNIHQNHLSLKEKQPYVDETRYIYIKDFDNDSVYSGPLFVNRAEGVDKDLGTQGYGFAVVGGDKDKVIINLIGLINERKIYTILFDLKNDMKSTVLWTDGN